MNLTAYVIDGQDFQIRAAPVERPWMDGTNQRFAYRCLPLNIANGHGWEILCPAPFTATWGGDPALEGISLSPGAPAQSHFGHGVLTFGVPALFRTDVGYDLYVTGPINRSKDGIAPLTGIVETDWISYSFTMNWLFTRTGTIRFEQDEPYCHIYPIKRGELERIEPRLCKLSENPELARRFHEWSANRNKFNADLKQPESDAVVAKWQKDYFRGQHLDGTPGADDHRSKLKLKEFK